MNNTLVQKIVSLILLVVCFVLFWKDSFIKEVVIYNIKFIFDAQKILIFTIFTYLLRPVKIDEYVMTALFALIAFVVTPSVLIPLFLIVDLIVLKKEVNNRFMNWHIIANSVLFTFFSSYFISNSQEINLPQFHYLILFIVYLTKWVFFTINRTMESKGIVDVMIFLPLLILLPTTGVDYLEFLLPIILIIIICNFVLSITYRTNQKELAFKDSVFLFSIAVLLSGNSKLAVLLLLISNYQFDQHQSYKLLIRKIFKNSSWEKEVNLITNGLLFTLLFPIGISLYYGSIFSSGNIFLICMIAILVIQFVKIYLLDYSCQNYKDTDWNQNNIIDIFLIFSLYLYTGPWRFDSVEKNSNLELIIFFVMNFFLLGVPILLLKLKKIDQFSKILSNWNVKFPVKRIEHQSQTKANDDYSNIPFELPVTSLKVKHTHVLVFMLMLITAIVILFLNKVSP